MNKRKNIIQPDKAEAGGAESQEEQEMATTPMQDDDCLDDQDDFGGPDLACLSCGGDGFVDSVVAETCRYGWDDDGPGTCPNCNGSGLRKDQQWF